MANRANILGTIVHVGDIVGVYHKIKEEGKERIQVFKGAVIAVKGKGTGKSFTVRRLGSAGVGVERIWPTVCPSLTKIQIIRRGKVRRAKLYYLRKKVGRQAVRIKTKYRSKKQAETSEQVRKARKVDAKKKPGKSGRKPSPKASSK
ncbi:MAG TPA: 50S ribosomal protein L19 [Candidatus Bathyarchaeia archaeon]|nr:50S ribosomal protein L19 [Candidatus Bathyarchaeia archaeon]